MKGKSNDEKTGSVIHTSFMFYVFFTELHATKALPCRKSLLPPFISHNIGFARSELFMVL